jgi:hypothetical protein
MKKLLELWGKIEWKTTSEIASAFASLATLGIALTAYLQLRTTSAGTAAIQRSETLNNLIAGVQRYKDHSQDAISLLLTLNNVAANRRAGILTVDDFEFLKTYLRSQEYLKGSKSLCEEWRSTKAKGPELIELVEAGLKPEACTGGEK